MSRGEIEREYQTTNFSEMNNAEAVEMGRKWQRCFKHRAACLRRETTSFRSDQTTQYWDVIEIDPLSALMIASP